MSQPRMKPLTPETIQSALLAAFGGALPAEVDAIVDREVAARMSMDDKLDFGWSLQGAKPALRVSVNRPEAKAALSSRFPAFAKHFEAEASARFGAVFGSEDDCVLLVMEPSQPVTAGVPSGFRPYGYMVFSSTGEVQPFTIHEAPPPSYLPAAFAAEAADLLGDARSYLWFLRWKDGAVTLFAAANEAAASPGAQAIIGRYGVQVPSAEAVRAHLESGGGEVAAVEVHFLPDGTRAFWLGGVREAAFARFDDPDIFVAGQPPTREAWVTSIGAALATFDKPAGEALAGDVLYPALVATVPAGTDPAEHFRGAWRAMFEKMAFETPPARRRVLECATWGAFFAAQEPVAFGLGLARFALAHPNVAVGDALAASYRGRDAESVIAEARPLRDLAKQGVATLAQIDAPETFSIPALFGDGDAVLDTLTRAITGDFTAAAGALYDWIEAAEDAEFDRDAQVSNLIDELAEEVDAERTERWYPGSAVSDDEEV
jgi:hypothetical protein